MAYVADARSPAQRKTRMTTTALQRMFEPDAVEVRPATPPPTHREQSQMTDMNQAQYGLAELLFRAPVTGVVDTAHARTAATLKAFTQTSRIHTEIDECEARRHLTEHMEGVFQLLAMAMPLAQQAAAVAADARMRREASEGGGGVGSELATPDLAALGPSFTFGDGSGIYTSNLNPYELKKENDKLRQYIARLEARVESASKGFTPAAPHPPPRRTLAEKQSLERIQFEARETVLREQLHDLHQASLRCVAVEFREATRALRARGVQGLQNQWTPRELLVPEWWPEVKRGASHCLGCVEVIQVSENTVRQAIEDGAYAAGQAIAALFGARECSVLRKENEELRTFRDDANRYFAEGVPAIIHEAIATAERSARTLVYAMHAEGVQQMCQVVISPTEAMSTQLKLKMTKDMLKRQGVRHKQELERTAPTALAPTIRSPNGIRKKPTPRPPPKSSKPKPQPIESPAEEKTFTQIVADGALLPSTLMGWHSAVPAPGYVTLSSGSLYTDRMTALKREFDPDHFGAHVLDVAQSPADVAAAMNASRASGTAHVPFDAQAAEAPRTPPLETGLDDAFATACASVADVRASAKVTIRGAAPADRVAAPRRQSRDVPALPDRGTPRRSDAPPKASARTPRLPAIPGVASGDVAPLTAPRTARPPHAMDSATAAKRFIARQSMAWD